MKRLHTSHSDGKSLEQKLRQPGIGYEDLTDIPVNIENEVKRQVEIRIKYAGYIEREAARAEKAGKLDHVPIPRDTDYHDLTAMRYESREKLAKIRPETLGQASRISGVNPADIAILQVWLKKT